MSSFSSADSSLYINSQIPAFRTEVIHADIGAADSALAFEPQPAVQNTPIVKDDGLAGLEFDSQQELWGGEDLVPFPGGGVPFLESRVVRKDGFRGVQAVQVVPADLDQSRRRRRGDGAGGCGVDEDWVALEGRGVVVERPDFAVALCSRQDRICRKGVV